MDSRRLIALLLVIIGIAFFMFFLLETNDTEENKISDAAATMLESPIIMQIGNDIKTEVHIKGEGNRQADLIISNNTGEFVTLHLNSSNNYFAGDFQSGQQKISIKKLLFVPPVDPTPGFINISCEYTDTFGNTPSVFEGKIATWEW